MRIGSAEDAESVVRKYFLGTRTSHGRIVSFSAEEKTEGPDDGGAWKVKGAYLTEGGVRAHFAATVSPRGEVLITSSRSSKPKTRQKKRSTRLSSADYAARRRRRKKQHPGKRTKPPRSTT
jgi:hypothetical protein